MTCVALHAVHYGTDTQVPIVILHGLLGSARNWGSTARVLSQNASVWALDLRNHGASPHAPLATYDAMAQDVLAWVQSHAFKKIYLIGHSMGGKVAMLFACRHPELIERLTIVDIAPKTYPEIHYGAEFRALHSLPLTQVTSRAQADAHLADTITDPVQRQFLLTNLIRQDDGHFQWQINLRALTTALPHLATNPLIDSDCFRGRVRFICGGQSSFVQPQDAACIYHHFPEAEIITLPNAGHNPHIEDQATFNHWVKTESNSSIS